MKSFMFTNIYAERLTPHRNRHQAPHPIQRPIPLQCHLLHRAKPMLQVIGFLFNIIFLIIF